MKRGVPPTEPKARTGRVDAAGHQLAGAVEEFLGAGGSVMV